MPYKPKSTDELYVDLRSNLKGESDKLTDFSRGSLNRVIFRQGFSRYWEIFEHARLATQLSGWVETAGGPIDEDDLVRLGLEDRIDSVDIDLLNSYMADEDLDRLVEIVGVVRDPGQRAIGTVQFTVGESTDEIPKGTLVATEAEQGESLVFETTETVRPGTNSTVVQAPIIAEQIGPEYNIGSYQIIRTLQGDVPVERVENPEATHEGQGPETNEELRQRAKNALISSSGGGTTGGIRGYIINNVDAIEQGDVKLEEHFDGQPPVSPADGAPYVNVVVDGGNITELNDALQTSRSSGMFHQIVRPTILYIDVNVNVLTDGIVSMTDTENVITNYISHTGIGESVYRDRLIQRVMNSDDDIINIEDIEMVMRAEPHTFESGVNQYELVALGADPPEGGVESIVGKENGSTTTFTKGTDYSLVFDTDGHVSHIEWLSGGTAPDTGTVFYVDYYIYEDVPISDFNLKAAPGSITATETKLS